MRHKWHLYLGAPALAFLIGCGESRPLPRAEQHIRRGHQLFDSERYLEATEEYEAALKLDPTNIECRQSFGAALVNCGKFEQANKELSAVILANPNFTKAYINRWNLRIRLNHLDAALADANKLIELDPESPHGYFFRGVSVDIIHNDTRSIKDFSKCILIDPGFYLAYHWRLSAYLRTRQLTNAELNTALADIKVLIEGRPEQQCQYKLNRGIAYAYAGKPKTAIDIYSELLKEFPRYADAYNNRAAAYFLIGKEEAANGKIASAKEKIEAAYNDARIAYQIEPDASVRANLRTVEKAVAQLRIATDPEVKAPPRGTPEPWLDAETKNALIEVGIKMAIYLIRENSSSGGRETDVFYRKVPVNGYMRGDGTYVRPHFRYVPTSRQ